MTTADRHVAAVRPRVDVATMLRQVRWRRVLAVAAASAVFAGITIATAFTVVDLHLPPDGAHYLADADSLIGRGARELRHPPAFPALVALVRPFTGRPDSFAWAMTASMALLPISLYVLARRWFTFGPSLIGAMAASFVPIIGELYSWGGGAMLLGTVMLIFTLAAMEWWIVRGGKGGFLVGACFAAIALTHALPLATAAVLIGVRWVVHLIGRRRLTSGWDPLGWRGIASVVAVSLPVFLLVYPLHQGPGASIGVPRSGTAWALLMWALGNEPLIFGLGILAIIGLQASDQPGVMVYGAGCLAIVILFPALLDADVTYANRAEYLLPIVVALGIASLAAVVRDRASRFPRFARPVLAVIVALGVIALTAYVPKLEAATPYYNTWISRGDLRLFEWMSERDGVVATSWRSDQFSSGVQLSWYVEGLASRPAYGPADPTLSNVEAQFEGGLDMQRVFVGTDGMGNGAVQVIAAPIGATADLSIQVASDGFNFPFLAVRSSSQIRHERPEEARSEVDDGLLVSSFQDAEGRPVYVRTVSLNGDTVAFRYVAARGTRVRGWAIELTPVTDLASGLRQLDRRIQGTVKIHGEIQRFSVTSGPGSDVAIVPGAAGTTIHVQAQRSREVAFEVRVSSGTEPGTVEAFEQEELLARYGVTDVLVMKDTGLLPRFDADPCYERLRHSRSLLLYRVRLDACLEGTTP